MLYLDVSSGNVNIQNDHEDQLSLGENILQVWSSLMVVLKCKVQGCPFKVKTARRVP